MKVFICKFVDETAIEDKVGQLVSRSRKRFGDNVRVFCVDEGTRKRLELGGIASEAFYEINRHYSADDESCWGKAYELSDLLHASAEHVDSLQYSGISFLNLEHDLASYVFAIRLSNLCLQMTAQDCKALILVLTKPYTVWFPAIASAEITTATYLPAYQKFRSPARRCLQAAALGYSFFRNAPGFAGRRFRGLFKKVNPARTAPGDEGKQKALFIVSTALYARPARAICNECIRNGIIPYVGLYEPGLVAFFQDHNTGVSRRSRLLAAISLPFELMKAVPLFLRLRKHISSFRDNAGTRAGADRFSAESLCTAVLLAQLPRLCFEAIYSIMFTERLIKAILPDIVCLMPDGYFPQQMAAALARKDNIPTLACSAVLETDNAPSYMRHLHADRIATMGEVVRNIYIESGVRPDRVVVTGIAHFDLLFYRDKERDDQVLTRAGIDPGKPIVVFATENLAVSETVEALTGVIDAVLKTSDVQLVVKVHPGEGIEPYDGTARRYCDPRIHVVKDIDLYAVISRCELIIVRYSTVALEAMMIGKPVVVINLAGTPVSVPYAQESAAVGVYRKEDIGPAIHRALFDEATRAKLKAGRDRFVREWAGEPDGRASYRVVSLMKRMIAEAPGPGKQGRVG
ncbi:MAG: UDP-N-acetylglucosamine 2-epimerase [Chloroflexi bacterium]|nr:UDP-N-acetylglucosamine 2-epimerase [Chloroflexota bacterium]